jgi:hypothetical protein
MRLRSFAPAVLALASAWTASGCRSVGADPDPDTTMDMTKDPDAPPPIPPKVDPAHLHFTRSQVQVGDVAPHFTLMKTDGNGALSLATLRGRPVVVVFGSFT